MISLLEKGFNDKSGIISLLKKGFNKLKTELVGEAQEKNNAKADQEKEPTIDKEIEKIMSENKRCFTGALDNTESSFQGSPKKLKDEYISYQDNLPEINDWNF